MNVAGQVLGSNAQFGRGCVGTGMGNVPGQAFGGVAASVTQQSNVPVSPLYQHLGFSGRTDGSNLFTAWKLFEFWLWCFWSEQ